MTLKLMDRLARLEASAAPLSPGKHLAFKVEAPHGTPTADIIISLRERGHAINDADDVLVMNVGAHGVAEDGLIRDLSPALLTEEVRAAASAGGTWPRMTSPFTFRLDSPRGAR